MMSDLVVTRRVDGLMGISLKVLADSKGRISVACDPVGVPPGQWVITAKGSAARYATGNSATLTDMTVCGIIDDWDSGEGSRTGRERRGDISNG